MFQIVAYVVQQLVIPLVPATVATLIIAAIEGGGPSPRSENVLWIALCSICGVAAGLSVGWWIPKIARAALFVWIVPTMLFSLAFVRERFSFAYSLTEFLSPGPEGEAWWLPMLAAAPTCCAIFYSAGVLVGAKRHRASTARSGTSSTDANPNPAALPSPRRSPDVSSSGPRP